MRFPERLFAAHRIKGVRHRFSTVLPVRAVRCVKEIWCFLVIIGLLLYCSVFCVKHLYPAIQDTDPGRE
jgi:hypothetical protein